MGKPAAALESLVASAVEAVGYELAGCELLRQGRHTLLRVYVDQEKGVTADDCAKASRQIASVLDVEDPIAGAYTLEVSSPGLDRPLYTKKDYQRFVGRVIKLRLRVPQDNQRQFSGVLKEVKEEEQIVLETEQGLKEFSLTQIDKANLVPELMQRGKK